MIVAKKRDFFLLGPGVLLYGILSHEKRKKKKKEGEGKKEEEEEEEEEVTGVKLK